MRRTARVIACHGSSNLLIALSVMAQRAEENGTDQCDDYLVIMQLGAAREAMLAEFLKSVAETTHRWKRVSLLPDNLARALGRRSWHARHGTAEREIRDLVGCPMADEIWLCLEWQLGSRLLALAYADAIKICHGDAVGIHFSREYHLREWGRSEGGWMPRLRSPPPRQVDIDLAYSPYPEVLPESTRAPIVRLEARHLERELLRWRRPERLAALAQHRSTPKVLLLSSNFSPARMTEKDEINAYIEFLAGLDLSENSLIIVKPHPRERLEKCRRLALELSKRHFEVLCLDDPEGQFLPSELIYMEIRTHLEPGERPTVVTFGTSGIPLRLFCDAEPIQGFGKEIVEKYFRPSRRQGWLRVEEEIRQALSKVGTSPSRLRAYPKTMS